MIEKLRKCLNTLSDGERELIQALFYDNLSERELSKKTGFHNMTIHNKKVRILKKLMEK
ncbi:MAG: sigma factor-like helix-turn-helix DNA-binding protein [Negativibacillus sp.]